MNVLHTRWRALVLALLLAVSLAVPAAAAELKDAVPNVAAPLRETYSAHRAFAPSPEVPVPYDTFAETFSYGLEQ